MDELERPAKQTAKELTVLGMAIALHALTFAVLNWLQFRTFYCVEWEDLAAWNQVAWHTAHGRLFYQTITDEYFLTHVCPIYLLLAIPYRVFPHIATFLTMGSLALAMGALPLYHLARRHVRVPGGALMFALTYLLYGPLHCIDMEGTYPIHFAVPLLILMALCFEMRWFGWFCLSSFLALLCKENVALVLVFLGLYGLWRRYPIRWPAFMLGVGLLWYFACAQIILPAIHSDQSSGVYFARWRGGGVMGIAASVLRSPLDYLRLALSHNRLVFLLQLLGPLCFLPLLSPAILVAAVPTFAQVLLLNRAWLYHSDRHWAAPALPFLMVAALKAVAPVCRFLDRLRHGPAGGTPRPATQYAVLTGLLVASAVSNFLPNIFSRSRGRYCIYDTRFLSARNVFAREFRQMDDGDRIAWDLIKLIPPDASVATSGDLLPALSSRAVCVQFGAEPGPAKARPVEYADVDWILLHFADMYFGSGRYRCAGDERTKRLLLELVADGRWEVHRTVGRFILLKARAPALASPAAGQAAKGEAEQFLESIGLQPGPGPLCEAAERAMEREDWDEAIHLLWKATEAAPDYSHPWHRLGRALSEAGRPVDAEQCYRRSISCQPTDLRAHFELGVLLLRQSRLDEAEVQFKVALSRLPMFASCVAALGETYLAGGRIAKAIRTLRRALRLEPDLVEARVLLAQALHAAGKTPHALGELRRALSHAKVPAVREQIREQIERLASSQGTPGS